MTKKEKDSEATLATPTTPALNTEQLENKLIALTLQNVEKDLINGTASSQVQSHFLKLASKRAEVELAKLETERKLLEEKIKSEQASRNLDLVIQQALSGFTSYRFDQDSSEDDYFSDGEYEVYEVNDDIIL